MTMRRMSTRARARRSIAARVVIAGWLIAAGAAPVVASVVTLNVTGRPATSVEDAVVVFDPLDATPPAAHKTVIIDQVNKRFKPRVSVIRTGTSVWFPNSDSIRHQVYSFSNAKPFTLKLYAGAPRMEVQFDKPGLVVLGCNIHDTMVAFIAVVETPYFSTVPASGHAELTMPPGKYRMRVWHPKMSQPFDPQVVTVDGEAMTIPVSMDVDLSRDSAATWPE